MAKGFFRFAIILIVLRLYTCKVKKWSLKISIVLIVFRLDTYQVESCSLIFTIILIVSLIFSAEYFRLEMLRLESTQLCKLWGKLRS